MILGPSGKAAWLWKVNMQLYEALGQKEKKNDGVNNLFWQALVGQYYCFILWKEKQKRD